MSAVGAGRLASPMARPRGRRADPLLLAAAAVIVLLVAAALFAPWLAPYPPDAVDIASAGQGLSAAHAAGTDALGRDNFARLLYGARLSLFGPLVVTALATVAGTTVAMTGAWFGGRWDRALARVLDVMFALPALIVAIVAVTVLGTGLLGPVVALALAYVPYVARVVRSAAVRQRHLPYMESCTLLGMSGPRTVIRHLLRNIRLFIVAQGTVTFGYALIDLAAISFIGLGVQAPTPEWGLMVADGAASLLNGNGSTALTAGGLIVVTVVAVNVLGERLMARAEAVR